MPRDPEKVRAYNRAYRERNRERLLAYGDDYRERNRERLRQWHRDHQKANTDRRRVAPYAMTRSELTEMEAQQSGRCAICGSLPSGKGPNAVLHIDHDHATGKVRGLLCAACNRGLGFFRDNPDALRAAADYVSP